MVVRHIDIDNGKWGILFVCDFDLMDWDRLSSIMQTFGLSERNINKSLKILSTYNSGMCVSRDDVRMSAIFIGKSTSSSQFWSTVNHELFHVEQAILDYYGTEWDGEPAAYLSGYLLQKVVEEIAEPCF